MAAMPANPAAVGSIGSLTATWLTEVGEEAGLDAIGTCRAASWTRARSTLETRREGELCADMAFTYRNPPRSTEPGRILRDARSILVGARGYARQERSRPRSGVWGRVADYAVGDHYAELRRSLDVVADTLRERGARCVVVVDDNALMDREAAWRAGIGWFGKNSNLLLPGAGSQFVLGSVVTDNELPLISEPQVDSCGSCERCLPACPTGAIVSPGVVDARRCLSWLLQAGGSFPIEYREALGDRIYGCDDCQDACPPNRTARRTKLPGPSTTVPEEATEGFVDVLDWLSMDDDDLLGAAGNWYVAQRDPLVVRRNLLIVLGNHVTIRGDTAALSARSPSGNSAKELLRQHVAHPDRVISETARWACSRLGVAPAVAGDEDVAL